MNGYIIDKLLRKISEGNNDAFAELYVKTKRGVYSFLYSYLHDHHDSEDAVQTTYLKIKRSIANYRQGTNGVAWILEIAKNTARDILRSRRYTEDIDTLAAESYDHSDSEITDLIERVLDAEEAKIVILHVIWGLKHREIGAALGMPTGSVTSKYKRSLEKLRKEMKR